MSIEFADGKESLKKRDFNLIGCKIHRKRISFYDERNERNDIADIVLFTFSDNMETSMFLSAYYDDAYPHHKTGISGVELPVYISATGMLAKARLSWPNKECDRPHFFLMTISQEATINARPELESTNIKVFPESMMDELGLMNGRIRG